MKKNLLLSFLVIIFGFHTSVSIGSDGEVETSVTFLNLPKPLVIRIGKLSGNTISLKSTCNKLRGYDYNTINETVILPYSEKFKAALQSLEGDNPDLSVLFPRDDTSVLNLFLLTADHFVKLGLQVAGKDLYDTTKAQKFYDFLHKGKILKVKTLILRNEDTQTGIYKAVHPGALRELNNLGINVVFVRERWNENIDRLFQYLKLNENEFNGLMSLVCLADPNEVVEVTKASTSLGQFASGVSPLPADSIPVIYYNGKTETTHHIGSREALIAAIDTYLEIANDKICWALIRSSGNRLMPVVHGFLRVSNEHPELLDTIKQVHFLHLSYGMNLFDSSCIKPEQLMAIAHEDRDDILRVIREFIPPFTPKDYHDAPGQPYHGLVKAKVSTIYGERQKSLPVKPCYTRTDLFADFVVALGEFTEETQLKRLRRLIKVMSIDHLRELELNDSEYNVFSLTYFPKRIIRAFTYIYNLTEDMHEVQYDGMLPIIADKAFNPLVEDAEAIFAQAVEVYKSKIAAKYAKE